MSLSNSEAGNTSENSGKRGRILITISIVLLIGLLAYGVLWLVYFKNFESTDDAYVSGSIVQVTSRIDGTVLSINADDTDMVEAGKPLVELDQTDEKLALDDAKNKLAETVRDVYTLYVNTRTLAANVKMRSVDVERERDDLRRRQELIETGAVSKEDVEHSRSALQSAESALEATRGSLSSNLALIENTSVAEHPRVLRSASQVRSAYLAYERTKVLAPVAGSVARRTVQVGQRIVSGTPLMSIIPLDSLWVDANFKEVQVAHMHINQPVILHADLYGTSTTYHGKVSGLLAGTGAAFALLPVQNASGNWIKVTQRLPVRIALDPKELQMRPLRIGMSMQVKVQINDDGGDSLPIKTIANTAYKTTAFDFDMKEADKVIAQIIARNCSPTRANP